MTDGGVRGWRGSEALWDRETWRPKSYLEFCLHATSRCTLTFVRFRDIMKIDYIMSSSNSKSFGMA